jgi:hypothetical protein
MAFISEWRHRSFPIFILCTLVFSASPALAQRRPATIREFLLQYKGKEILVVDKTGGTEQFVSGEASKTYTVLLNDVQSDHIIVSRDSDTDKRTFLYPISIIRRIIYQYDGKPYQKIVLEMY